MQMVRAVLLRALLLFSLLVSETQQHSAEALTGHDMDIRLKKALDLLVDKEYNGNNEKKILKSIYVYLQSRLTPEQWNEIITEFNIYQQFDIDCAQYARFLSPFQYKILLALIREAVSSGADKYYLKKLLNEFLKDEFMEQYKIGKKQSDALPKDEVDRLVKPLFPLVRPWFVASIR